ncbi:MAG: protein kinase [Ignavibacteriales bacterium]|nr:protein kinase [Ignavibacteriales bacterium]
MIGTTISHYKILEKLGEGGMGVAYKAQDTKLDRFVALKFLPHHLTTNDAEKARFLQEAKAAAALNHPNICTIHGIEEDGDEQFIVMEYVDGVTLREKFAPAPIPVKEAITYGIQIGEALEEAHAKGIVHRDIKSDNIMVNKKNQIKVMDFGLAKLKGSLKLTKATSTVGTLGYMSPEQIQGRETDGRSDIFSCGIVLFEMLTARLPFRGEHDAAMMYSIVNEEPESIQQIVPNASSELLHVLNTALEKQPEDRYQTVAEMVRDLRRAQKQTSRVSRVMPVPTPTAEQLTTAAPPASKTKLWVGLTTALAFIIIGFVLFFPKSKLEINPNATTRVLKIPFTQVGYPGLSPDGNWVAFPAADAKDQWEIYWMNVSGGEPRRVTTDSRGFISYLDISPDGSIIAYNSQNPKTGIEETFVVSSQGGVSKRVAEVGTTPRWHPGGKRIGYFKRGGFSKSGKPEIWSVKPDGSDNRIEFIDTASVPGGTATVAWSPDGESVAWARHFREDYSEVFTRELKSGKERQLTFDKKNLDEVCWTIQNEILFTSNKGGNANLWIVSATGGESVQLTKGSGPDIGMKITADGNKLVYLQRLVVAHIFVADANGSNVKQITFDDNLPVFPSLSPDHQKIVFQINPDPLNEVTHLYAIDRTGENRRQLTSGDQISGNARWSPDGKWIAYDSRLVSEPTDSTRIYLLDMIGQATPRVICRGRTPLWISSDSLLAVNLGARWLASIYGGEPKPFNKDFPTAIPIGGSHSIMFRDYDADRGGLYVVSSKGTKIDTMKISDQTNVRADDSRRFAIYHKTREEVWMLTLATGTEERLKDEIPVQTGSFNMSYDGKEIVFAAREFQGKLVLMENLRK